MTKVRQQLATLKTLRPERGARDLEDLIAEIFQAMGSQTSEPLASDEGFDLAVWINEVEPVIPNPLLVETRWHIRGGAEQRKLETQFQRQLSKVRSFLGIIVYLHHDSIRKVENTTSWPLIVYLHVDELIDLAESGQLAKKLISERNAHVHLGRPSN